MRGNASRSCSIHCLRSNTTTHVHTQNVAPKSDKCFFEIHGTKGSAWLVGGKIVETNIESLKEPAPPECPDAVTDFMHAIRQQRPPEVTVEQGRRSVELILAIYESARRNKTIRLK